MSARRPRADALARNDSAVGVAGAAARRIRRALVVHRQRRLQDRRRDVRGVGHGAWRSTDSPTFTEAWASRTIRPAISISSGSSAGSGTRCSRLRRRPLRRHQGARQIAGDFRRPRRRRARLRDRRIGSRARVWRLAAAAFYLLNPATIYNLGGMGPGRFGRRRASRSPRSTACFGREDNAPARVNAVDRRRVAAVGYSILIKPQARCCCR